MKEAKEGPVMKSIKGNKGVIAKCRFEGMKVLGREGGGGLIITTAFNIL